MFNTIFEDMIYQTKNDHWVIKGDERFPAWIEQSDRLDHDRYAIPIILPHIKVDSLVIDVGANIGTHTCAYIEAVGDGYVCAYEPNPIALECLRRNCPLAYTSDLALSDAINSDFLEINDENPGASCLTRGSVKGMPVKVSTLDYEFGVATELEECRPVSFIKIDVEGCEPEVLRGGKMLIARERPAMWIEINPGALARRGNHAMEIKTFLDQHNYSYQFYPENHTWDSPQSDILCLPK